MPSIAIAVAATLATTAVPVHRAHAQAAETKAAPKGKKTIAGVKAFTGKLADGTPFLLRKPANWNGIVIRDLDGISKRSSVTYQMLLKAGYGTAATSRRSEDRAWTLNRLHDVRRQEEAVAAFKAKFGKPKLVIAFGNSAGGASSIVSAELFPDTIDGAVAMCPTMDFMAYAGFAQIFDFFYIMKALLAPTDNMLATHALPPRGFEPILARWQLVLGNAAKTPEGRAKIALGFALSQYPVYAKLGKGDGIAAPDFTDPKATIDAMIQTLPQIVGRLERLRVYGEKDFPADLKIPGTPQPDIAGNDGAVYAEYWKNANPAYKQVAEALYKQAGGSVAADLRAIDAAPRVTMDRTAFNRDWLLGRGLPGVPVFRVENLGDLSAVPNISKLYDDLIVLNGLGDLYRKAHVDNSGHCGFQPGQQFAAIEVMRERLQTGNWPATDAGALNAHAAGDATDRRTFVERQFGPFTGAWRFATYADLFAPMTFVRANALTNMFAEGNLIKRPERQQLLAQLADAKRAAGQGNAAQAAQALDRFAGIAGKVGDRRVRTRLLAAAHQLRSAR